MSATQPVTSYPGSPVLPEESSRSAVSWPAVFAGAVIAAAVSAMLVTGGAGLGFLTVSPWRGEGASGSTLAVGSIIWLLFSQVVAYGVAGYVAGRLRTKWAHTTGDEIYFRDTAHGFLVWALSAVIWMALLGSTVAAVVSGTAKAGATLAGTGAAAATAGQAGAGDGPLGYYTDALLRPDDPSMATGRADVRPEVSRILARSLVNEPMSDDDQAYLARLVAQHAGLDETAARQRLEQIQQQVRQAEQQAREAADAARKAAAGFALWAFASLLIGAFVASFAATLGGRARDQ
ncbi:hypothetical protein [Bordetella petrii]|uniref:hypothetical protein n=1 Tax=Bordetella petrii TaxID=94624 RepID=UPI001E62C8B8|nr:hypothetical protein [Bordetella petrii]MCD0504245.1 hypothetical protein [Bordetella petrii]